VPGKVLRNLKLGGFDHKASGAAATVLPTSESLWQECGSNTPKQIELDVTTRLRNAGRSWQIGTLRSTRQRRQDFL